VKRGADLLDEKLPGWFIEIDLYKLELSNACQCVLGQLATDIVPRRRWLQVWRRTGDKPRYFAARDELHLNDRQCKTHGFTADDDAGVSYMQLDEAWKVLIKRRLRLRTLS
jgi:hypothetical protein